MILRVPGTKRTYPVQILFQWRDRFDRINPAVLFFIGWGEAFQRWFGDEHTVILNVCCRKMDSAELRRKGAFVLFDRVTFWRNTNPIRRARAAGIEVRGVR